MPDGRVLIAFADDALDPSPTWTRIDDTDNLVAGIDIRRGRQTELDQTDTSTATVYVNDTDGLFDPNNTSSPYFGELDGKQIMLQVFNPVTSAWVTQFRGHIDDYGHDFEPSMAVANVQIECVDLFEYLSAVQMMPFVFGTTPPSGSEGVVYYASQSAKLRAEALLDDAGLPGAMYSVFTMNVDLRATKYDPGDAVLAALRDTVDAEFPGIANVYTDKAGRVCVHGRFARFDPEGTVGGSDWVFTRWPAATGGAVTTGVAQVRPPLRWSRPRSNIINSAIAYPRGIAEAAISGQVYEDSASIASYGYRSWAAIDLLTSAGTTTGNTAAEETKLFAEYYVENYKQPRTRVEALTFKSIDPDDARATGTWALIAGVDISDVIELTSGYPGGVGMSEDFFVEGSEMSIRPLNPDFDMVELTLNVSPSAWFTTDVFTP